MFSRNGLNRNMWGKFPRNQNTFRSQPTLVPSPKLEERFEEENFEPPSPDSPVPGQINLRTVSIKHSGEWYSFYEPVDQKKRYFPSETNKIFFPDEDDEDSNSEWDPDNDKDEIEEALNFAEEYDDENTSIPKLQKNSLPQRVLQGQLLGQWPPKWPQQRRTFKYLSNSQITQVLQKNRHKAPKQGEKLREETLTWVLNTMLDIYENEISVSEPLETEQAKHRVEYFQRFQKLNLGPETETLFKLFFERFPANSLGNNQRREAISKIIELFNSEKIDEKTKYERYAQPTYSQSVRQIDFADIYEFERGSFNTAKNAGHIYGIPVIRKQGSPANAHFEITAWVNALNESKTHSFAHKPGPVSSSALFYQNSEDPELIEYKDPWLLYNEYPISLIIFGARTALIPSVFPHEKELILSKLQEFEIRSIETKKDENGKYTEALIVLVAREENETDFDSTSMTKEEWNLARENKSGFSPISHLSSVQLIEKILQAYERYRAGEIIPFSIAIKDSSTLETAKLEIQKKFARDFQDTIGKKMGRFFRKFQNQQEDEREKRSLDNFFQLQQLGKAVFHLGGDGLDAMISAIKFRGAMYTDISKFENVAACAELRQKAEAKIYEPLRPKPGETSDEER